MWETLWVFRWFCLGVVRIEKTNSVLTKKGVLLTANKRIHTKFTIRCAKEKFNFGTRQKENNFVWKAFVRACNSNLFKVFNPCQILKQLYFYLFQLFCFFFPSSSWFLCIHLPLLASFGALFPTGFHCDANHHKRLVEFNVQKYISPYQHIHLQVTTAELLRCYVKEERQTDRQIHTNYGPHYVWAMLFPFSFFFFFLFSNCLTRTSENCVVQLTHPITKRRRGRGRDAGASNSLQTLYVMMAHGLPLVKLLGSYN